MEQYGFLVRGVDEKVWWFRVVQLFLLNFLLAGENILNAASITQRLVISLVFFAVDTLCVLWTWPLQGARDNVQLVSVGNARLVACTVTFALNPSPAWALIGVLIALDVLCLGGSGFFASQKLKTQSLQKRIEGVQTELSETPAALG